VAVALTASGTVGAKPILTQHLPLVPTEPSQFSRGREFIRSGDSCSGEGHRRPSLFLCRISQLYDPAFAFDLNGAEVHELRDIETTADTLGVGLAVELDVGVSVGLGVGVGVGGSGVGTTALAGKTTALP
jgi:hypothetical protein